MAGYQVDLRTEKLLHHIEGPTRILGKLTGRKPHISAVRRFYAKGSKGIRLPAIIVGGQKYTTEGAVLWWIEACSRAAANATSAPTSPKVGAPLSAGDRATLAKFGISEVG